VAKSCFDWRRGDVFAVPPWTRHEHAKAGDEPAILFSIRDIPVFEALGLHRKEAYAENSGHQRVTSVFEG
jgi:gentisate 1,2-dioxygenase